jgi:uncharacterized protein YjbI with pentapeptide repeats
MERNNQYKDTVWELKTKVSQCTFEDFDFSNTNFNSTIFENVVFKNCLFFKSNLSGSKLFYQSNFEDCKFINVNLSNTTFGSNRGVYKGCLFEKCNFKGKEFDFTEFINCDFVNTKMKNINFNGSKFDNCRFIGKIEDITFNGIYNTNPNPSTCLKEVDFSQAVFGEFVTFFNCDLSICTPPVGTSFYELLYNLYSNDPSILSTGSKDRIVIEKR